MRRDLPMNIEEMLKLTRGESRRLEGWTPECPAMPLIWEGRLSPSQRLHVLTCQHCRKVVRAGKKAQRADFAVRVGALCCALGQPQFALEVREGVNDSPAVEDLPPVVAA